MRYLEAAYIAVIGISFLVSLISFRLRYPWHFRFFSLLLGLTFIVEFSAVYIVRWCKIGSNAHIYNSFMLVEFCAYAYFYKQIFHTKKARLYANFLLFLLPACWLITTIWKFGFTKWNSYFSIVGSCATVVLAIVYYVQLLRFSEPMKILKMAEFIIASAMLLFYTCVVPYLGSLNYLNNNLSLSYQLLIVLRSLNIIMYSLFIYAFLCQRTMKK